MIVLFPDTLLIHNVEEIFCRFPNQICKIVNNTQEIEEYSDKYDILIFFTDLFNINQVTSLYHKIKPFGTIKDFLGRTYTDNCIYTLKENVNNINDVMELD